MDEGFNLLIESNKLGSFCFGLLFEWDEKTNAITVCSPEKRERSSYEMGNYWWNGIDLLEYNVAKPRTSPRKLNLKPHFWVVRSYL